MSLGKIFIIFSELSSYLQAEVLHKPLVSQEVAGHVGVSVVDQPPQAQREQLQIHVLHCCIQGGVLLANFITTNKRVHYDQDPHGST